MCRGGTGRRARCMGLGMPGLLMSENLQACEARHSQERVPAAHGHDGVLHRRLLRSGASRGKGCGVVQAASALRRRPFASVYPRGTPHWFSIACFNHKMPNAPRTCLEEHLGLGHLQRAPGHASLRQRSLLLALAHIAAAGGEHRTAGHHRDAGSGSPTCGPTPPARQLRRAAAELHDAISLFQLAVC